MLILNYISFHLFIFLTLNQPVNNQKISNSFITNYFITYLVITNNLLMTSDVSVHDHCCFCAPLKKKSVCTTIFIWQLIIKKNGGKKMEEKKR